MYTIGVWRILMQERSARYHPVKMAKFANLCSGLHNIAIHYKVKYGNIETIVADVIAVERENERLVQIERTSMPTQSAPSIKRRGEEVRDQLMMLLE